jgi:DNA uptake protein ComE-like DNA-binding protein
MNPSRYPLVFALFLLAASVACTQPPQNSEQLKEKTAAATAQMKADAQAVASGIREGWSRDKPLDLNSATRDQLLSLPGMTDPEADRVIAARPYNQPDDLVKRRILPKAEYDQITDRITAKP